MQTSGFYLNPNGYTVLSTQVVDRYGRIVTGPIYSHNQQIISQSSNGKVSFIKNPTPQGGTLRQPNDSMKINYYNYGSDLPGIEPGGVHHAGEKCCRRIQKLLLGNDPSQWASHCMTYLGVVYRDMYPGIDVHYFSEAGKLKYTPSSFIRERTFPRYNSCIRIRLSYM